MCDTELDDLNNLCDIERVNIFRELFKLVVISINVLNVVHLIVKLLAEIHLDFVTSSCIEFLFQMRKKQRHIINIYIYKV